MTPRTSTCQAAPAPGVLDALARADARRHDGSARADVVDAYLRHRDHLAPHTSEGSRRVWFLLEHVPRGTKGLEELFAHAGAYAVERDVADRSLVAAATFATSRGDFDTAQSRLREALRRRRGSDTAIERSACINLARMLRSEGRPAEALLVSRRAATMRVEDDDVRGRTAALLGLAGALVDLQEIERAEQVVADVARELPDAPNDQGSLAVRRQFDAVRVHLAHHARRYDEALWRLDVMHTHTPARTPYQIASLASHRAHILIDALRGSEAALRLREVRRVQQDGRYELHDEVRLSVMEARAADLLGIDETARERATSALREAAELVDVPGPHRFWIGQLVVVFERLGDAQNERRCLEILSTEHLEQLVRMERIAREIPELTGPVCTEDREILRRARERSVADRRKTLAAFAELLAPAISRGDDRALFLVPPDDDTLRVCAWCARIAGRDGSWLALGHVVPTSGPVRATHGMCGDCVADCDAALAEPSAA